MKFRSTFFREELKKFACLLVAMVLILSLTVGDYTGLNSISSDTASAEEASTTVSYTDMTGSLDFSNLQVSNFSSSVMTNSDGDSTTVTTGDYETRTVIVSFEEDSMLEGADGVAVSSYETTSAGKKTEENIEKSHKAFYQYLASEGIEYTKVYSFKNIDNAVAIQIDTSYVSQIKELDGVESVVIGDSYSKPEDTDSTSSSATTNATSVYATGIYDSSDYVEQYGGKGMTVAILDTGLDYTHEAFQLTDDPNDYYYTYSQTFKQNVKWTEDDVAELIAAGGLNASGDVYVSAKVPFAFDYSDNDADVYPSYSNHGTHVAGIIAGRAASYSDSDGNLVYADGYDENSTTYTKDGYDYIFADEDCTTLATEEFIGVAPYAQLVICKVFTDDLDDENLGGATTEDILAALEDCVELGVDVINMSLGSTNGFSSTDDGDDEGEYMNNVYTAIGDNGISLVVAASNDYSSGYGSTFGTNLASNPDSGTVGSPSTYAAAISVASISGKMSSYLIANAGTDSETSVFFRESADENSVDYDFVAEMLELGADNAHYDAETGELNIKYVVIPNVGQSTDYTNTIKKYIKAAKEDGYLVVALVKRGTNTFQDKVENAMSLTVTLDSGETIKALDGVIVYNNVAGEIKMTIGDIEDPIPAISITQVAGQALVDAAVNYTGTITICDDYEAGPFMSDFSSWGVTSDLKLKPEITAHGGEITSAVPGGYSEMSGTSMATPNVSGLMANILSYIKQNYQTFFPGEEYSSKKATQLAYQLLMSTATTVYDEDGLPYSPRKQGAGLGSLDNVVSTLAYLSTDSTETIESHGTTYTGADTDRPKIEIGEDENKVGVYTLVFYYNNVSSASQTFSLKTLFFTESLSLDGLAVAEQAYTLEGQSSAVWTINGATYSNGDKVTLGVGQTRIVVTLTLSEADKAYLDESFVNGMFVEGFLQLVSETEGQCDLSIPFLGFYGDWESAPMLDYSAYEIAEIEADTSIKDEEKASETVWATQAYTTYWNGTYVLPMGSFLYSQDEDADQIYASEEYASVSCYNDETATSSNSTSYMTAYEIKGLYAGLLRNAKYVTATLTDNTTGEVIYTKVVYRVGKAIAGGGSASPAYVKLDLSPEALGLVENGTYNLEFNFFFNEEQYKNNEVTDDNTFAFSFTIDYTAPVLEDVRIRYVDYKDTNGNAQQRVYLDLDVYDNHYAMAVLLCYLHYDSAGEAEYLLATDYVTPVYNAVKNGTTTVTIEITDIIDMGLSLYVEIDDYSLNHSIYSIDISTATSSVLPDTFTVNESTDSSGNYAVSVDKLSTYTISLDWDTTTYSSANLSNFTWTVISGGTCVAVKNGEIVGLKAGSARIRVTGANNVYYDIYVTVNDSSKTITSYPSLSFASIYNSSNVPVAASGTVDVNIDQEIKLEVEYDPWYYELVADTDKVAVELVWSSSNESVATVDQSGNVTLKKKGTAIISATISGKAYSAIVTLSVQDPFTVSSYSLTKYSGSGGVVYIPTDMNIMTIGDEAFKDNTTITAVIIPKTVTTIGEKAFYGCTNLKYVFFVDVVTQDIADAELTMIEQEAFEGCTSLEYVDFSNCKTFTVARYAFNGCTSLQVIKGLENIGTAYDYAFEGCTSLVGSVSADSDINLVNSISYYNGSTHSDLDGVYNFTKNTTATDVRNVTFTLSETLNESDTSGECIINVNSVDSIAGKVTTLDITGLHVSGRYVFSGCNSLKGITTGEFTSIGAYMFYDCDGEDFSDITIQTASVGAYAFSGCKYLIAVTFENITNGSIGRGAFYNSGNLYQVNFGENVTISSIGDYAFGGTYIESFTLPSGLTSLGEDIFYRGELNELVITTDLSDVTFTGSTFDSITSITLDEALEALVIENNILYNKDKTKAILALNDAESYEIASTVTEIGDYAFAGAGITSVTLPAGLVEIGEYAFYNCSGITSVSIPATVKTIGEGAFYNCPALASLTFEGEAVTTIGDGAFENTALTAITIPASVTYIGSYAFAGTPVTSFTYTPSQNAELGSYVFANCTSLASIALADNITVIGDATFYRCTALTTAAMPSVTELGWYTFFGATNLESVTFGDDATTAGEYTFYSYDSSYGLEEYDSLTSVTLGGKTTSLGGYVFLNCTALTSIDLSKVTSIGEYAFWNNTALASVTGLDNVTYIGSYAFYNCPLTEIDISMVKTIGDFAFYGNKAATITIPADLDGSVTETVSELSSSAVYNVNLYYDYDYTYSTIGAGVFANASNLTKFVVEEGNDDYFADDSGVLYRVLSDGGYELIAFPSALKVTDYTVLDGTVRINAYAFAYLTAGTLINVTLPYELASIGIGAFWSSGVKTYNFTSVTAPILEAEVSYETTTADEAYYYAYYMTYLGDGGGIYRGLYNTNFEEGLINFANNIVYVYNTSSGLSNIAPTTSTLAMSYPSNGTGYDNYVYSHYFGVTSTTAVVRSVDTNNVAVNLTSSDWYSVEKINSWLTAEVTDELTEVVTEFSDLVKNTHLYYNNIKNDSTQMELLAEKLAESGVTIDLLSETEEALSAVKSRFGITVSFSSAEVDTSSYKSSYIAGETFDMTGLTVVVTYDDYSEVTYTYENGDLQLASGYDRELTIYDQDVKVIITDLNRNVYVVISVSEEASDTPDDSSGSGDSTDSSADSSSDVQSGTATGCGSITSGGGFGGMTGLLSAMFIGAIYIAARRRKSSRGQGDINE
ncbi:MAG: leucine-rich repeat protein [Clostridia bacterium]|nr:leucine-rich repeat protein [Clostridia bacterium]